MYSYGHGSWIALVILGGVLLVRLLSSQGRRDRHPGHGPANQFTASRHAPPAGPPEAPASPSDRPAAGSGLAPGWFTDPTGRHGERYWSGAEWTEHVLDDGVPGTDPPPAPRRPTPS